MKKRLVSALILAALLLPACGHKEEGTDQSSDFTLPSRPAAAGDLLPPEEGEASSGSASADASQPEPEPPAPAPEVLDKWRGEYREEVKLLRQSLSSLAKEYEMTSCTRWPDGRMQVDTSLNDEDNLSLLFSGPISQKGSASAAVALELRQSFTLDELKAEWGEALTFRPDDPVAGPSWAVSDDGVTYHFRADSTGQMLLTAENGGNLVISIDSLVPESPDPGWIQTQADQERWWEEGCIREPEGPLAALLAYTQSFGGTELPAGSSALAAEDIPEAFSLYGCGAKDPTTGTIYLSYEGGENTLWCAALVPAETILGADLPQTFDAAFAAMGAPGRWSAYDLFGYWFELEDYTVCLESDHTGAVAGDSYFLVY